MEDVIEEPSVCFVEGFKFGKILESLCNHVSILRNFEEAHLRIESEVV
ncbi:MAG: hypothetical protein NZ932_03900 [Candidatus Bathyarchaeota archaeon]|nr:hypothetical protein [Candidatus Bathyarchaeota archaeon]